MRPWLRSYVEDEEQGLSGHATATVSKAPATPGRSPTPPRHDDGATSALQAVCLGAALCASYLVLVGASLRGQVRVYAIAAAASLVLDWLMRCTKYRRLLLLLGRNGASPSWRFSFRRLLTIVLLYQVGRLPHASIGVVVVAVVGLHALFVITSALSVMISERRLRRIETRNLQVVGPELAPDRVPRLRNVAGMGVLHAEVLLVAALLWAGFSGHYGLVVPSAVAMLISAAIVPAVLVLAVIELRRMPSEADRMASAQQAVNRLAPVAVLYFSGGLASVYQVNTWLSTMERLDRPVLVVLRERRYLTRLNETGLPVLCVPFAADLMNFELPSVRVSLYVANVGKNIHLLRVPTMKSAFIGHGDSDKTASFNPFTKVYDEVWVAGEAGRERYLHARVGVRDDDVIEVGRPQLDGIGRAGDRPVGDPYTVLYAPTWEGWVDDPFATSLMLLGRSIVEELIATSGVRVVYKPHPLTGTVTPAARAANEEIVSLISATGAPHLAVLDDTPLYDCFNSSDALISDISSVVSDYLRSDKPYFVTNATGRPDKEFRTENPSAGAAYLIGPGGAGLKDGLINARGRDTLAAARRRTSRYVLGDPAVDALDRFQQAIKELAAKAEANLVALRKEAHNYSGAVDQDRNDLLALDRDESEAAGGQQADRQVGAETGGSTGKEI